MVKVRHQLSGQRALIKMKIKFSSNIRKFRMEQLQVIYGEIFAHFLIYQEARLIHDFATAPL